MEAIQELNYFSLEKYIKDISIDSLVLEHLAEFQEEFNNYVQTIIKFGDDKAMDFLTSELYNELLFSHLIEENKILPPTDYLNSELVRVSKILTNKRICCIQKIIMQNRVMPYPIGEYRTVPAFIRRQGEIVYWAPKAEELTNFMKDFIRIYNKNDDSLLNNDPFIKTALVLFLFIKIHPFVDGNGRTARILGNLKFTDLINRTYRTKEGEELNLKLAPLNISYSIYNNKQSYYDRLNSIPFFEGADINESFNKWLNFLIYMYEEQLNYNLNSNKHKNLTRTLGTIQKR